MDAQQKPSNQVSLYGQYDAAGKLGGGALGYEISNSSKSGSLKTKTASLGISLLTTPNVYINHVHATFGSETPRIAYSYGLLHDYSQKISLGLEGNCLFKLTNSLRAGAGLVATETRNEAGRMQFYIQPTIEGKWEAVHVRVRGLLNWIPGENPFIYDKGFDAQLSFQAGSWGVFSEYGTLQSSRPLNGKTQVFDYLRAGCRYLF